MQTQNTQNAKPKSVEERLAEMEAMLAAERQARAESEAKLDLAQRALAAKPKGGGVLSWYIANDGQPAGEPDPVVAKGLSGSALQEYNRKFCKGSISVAGINARFPITLYREQWLRFLDGIDGKADGTFVQRFVAYLTSPECENHPAVKAASVRKAASKA